MSAGSASQNEILNRLFEALGNKSSDTRQAAARDLRRYVASAIVDVNSKDSARLWDEHINRRLFDLIHSNNNTDKLGGILAIDHLIDVDQEHMMETRRNLFRFYHYLITLLPNPDLTVMVAASKSLGKIAKIGDNELDQRLIEHEVPKAIEFLSSTDKTEQNRYAGVLVLKELARNCPMYFNQHITVIFDKIILPLRDPRAHVREAASELLADLLGIMEQMKHHSLEYPFLEQLIEHTLQGIKTTQVEIIHGSLLAYRELLLHADTAMRDTFCDTVETVFHYKSHRDVLIRQTVVTLIPTFAIYDHKLFSAHFLHMAMTFLLTQADKPSERPIVFVAIGHVACAVGGEIKPFLDPIMHSIKQAFHMRGGKNAPSDAPVFRCLGMLASSVGPSLTKLLHDQLDLIFNCDLSEPLRSALVSIAKHIPPLLKTIQDRLLGLLSVILTGHPYVSPKAHSWRARTETAATKSRNFDTLSLALDTLGTFNFCGHVLTKFAQAAVLPYLEDDHVEVRKAAVLSCCRLFLPNSTIHQTSSQAVDIIDDVLGKLLTVGIADPDPTVRQMLLSSLDDHFEKRLAQTECVRSLFLALNDEVFTNRVHAVALIGRVAKHNPAYVIPSVRKALTELLSELEYATVARSREDASRLLTLLTSVVPCLIKPYTLPMIRVILPKTGDANPVVAGQTLMCVGELMSVGVEELTAYIPQIMSVILSTLDDPAVPSKQEAALLTLGQLCTNTGYVVTPIVEHPRLIPLLGRFLKSELSANLRRQAMRVLGILGAIDPYRWKMKSNEDFAHETPTREANTLLVSRVTTPASDDYYQIAVIDALLGVLKHQSLKSHHLVEDSIISIFKLQGFKCFSILPQIVPTFSSVTRSSQGHLQAHHLEQLSILITTIKQHVRNFVPLLINLFDELWPLTSLQSLLVSFIEAVGKSLNKDLRFFLPSILPRLLQVFEGDLTDRHTETKLKVFEVLLTFGPNIEEHMHLIIPVLVKSFECLEEPILLRVTAIVTIEKLSQWVNLSHYASRLIYPLVRVLPFRNTDLRMAVMDTICALVHQLGPDFVYFISTINKCVVRHQILHDRFEKLVHTLLDGEPSPASNSGLEKINHNDPEFSDVPEIKKLTPNQQHLKEAWDVSLVTTKDEWLDWFKEISVQFMKESSSVAIRSCINVLDLYPQIAEKLFNVAFLSCWGELYGSYQDDLVRSIERAIMDAHIPPYVFQMLLNLVEFMERNEERLPIETKTLGECALRFHAYGKALYYKELEFLQASSSPTVEALIGINTNLQRHDSAHGMLTVAQEHHGGFIREDWLVRLGRWQEALDTYDRKPQNELFTLDATLGKMRCLHALNEWDRLFDLVNEHWVQAGHEDRRKMAPLAAAAAWSLSRWDAMDEYIGAIPRDSSDRSFYRAIISVHRNQFTKAANQIMKARDLLAPALASVVGDPGRGYNLMVQAQMLSELEEIISYKQLADQPERQEVLRRTWRKRLQGCQLNIEVWQQALQLRTLVLRPEDEPTLWIKFAHLCRKNNSIRLGEKIFNSLPQPNYMDQKSDLRTVYAHLKFIWASGDRHQALNALHRFSEALQRDLSIKAGESKDSHQERVSKITQILARCYVKDGQWQTDMMAERTLSSRKAILQAYYSAAQLDPKWYKAWHIWSLANFEFIGHLETHCADHPDGVPSQELLTCVISAVEGFFRSIALCNDSALQDILRLLTLLFNFGAHEDVSSVVIRGLVSVETDIWLEVIPQIMARIQTNSVNTRRVIIFLLRNIGKNHPQALIYPLTVASKSTSEARKIAAIAIMDYMRERGPTVVEQAIMVSHELIRVTILWHELWHEGLEEASRLYFTEKDPEGMVEILEPLHDLLDEGPHSLCETSFAQVFGRDLQDARDLTRRFLQYGETSDLDYAWDIYYGVFRKVEKQILHLNALDLQYVSPELLRARDLELAVPGTYRSDRPTILISRFVTKLTVITSRRRPRRFSIKGGDGRDYHYLLKGNEDLRQDERVMQLFNLVNTLLAVDTNSVKRGLHIQCYAVIPLAPNAGLVGWVPGENDTLHTLVREYRDPRGILLNLESRLMLQMAPDYEFLPLLQKVEVFEHVRNTTTGQDLNRMLWLRSYNSESWLNLRATYSRSLAVNSIVGHILGLGDRHPNNILIRRATGKVINVDFGDCFEVAMYREKFPEKVPFRLTRMLINAMEVSGVQGNFKVACEITMGVVRDNKDSLMALLEAFVYDPLISWRFIQANAKAKHENTSSDQLSRAAYAQGAVRKVKTDENDIFDDAVDDLWRRREVRNGHALQVFRRVLHKLTGRDFNPDIALPVEAQVDWLIQEATSSENLCQCFSGWCALW